MRDDIYYRSVHYVNLNEPLAQDKAATSSVAEATDDYASNDNYLQFVPGKGEEFVHGLVKCKAVTSENNCVPYAGQVEEEITRKFALTLGPVHILRDAAKLVAPWRLTFVKQPQIETLIVGLHGGGLPRWLSSAFPNFNVDVVERDGSLARVCRNYLGFRESSNLRLWIGDPEDYIRHVAVQGLTKDTDGRTAKEASSKRYDLVMIDAIDGNGNLSSRYGRLEFINSVRNAMSNAGCVAIALPNQQGQFVYNMVQNWRMGFTGRTVVLVHCMTSPVTMLMTFQDNAERGKANIGSVANVDEFSDLLRSHLKHYGPNRVPFDLTGEINRDNFKVLEPGRSYDLAAYLPPGHPDVGKRSKEKKSGGGIQEWLKRASQSLLSPAMKDDIKRNGI
ncbi:hypothetical protein, conserved [Angomonas deanei]|uniref:Spermine/spermidine synthase n=1 Tax=Angomonas deanei TaxID=59799 RepID=A0A7G2C082_9TRYP|nr:hypothetical protein, conserved [Angomonas deanei]